jgi:hypothetical protein
VFVVLSLVGCWSLSTDVDVSGSAADEGGAPAGEAGSEAESEADASPDASLIDGSRADALPDGAPLGFCDGYVVPPRICDDFDVGALGAKWTRIENAGTGTSTLGTAVVKSAPNAYLSRLANGCAAGEGAQLIDDAPGSPAEVKLDMDVSIAPMGSEPSLQLAGVEYSKAGGNTVYRVDVAYRNTHLELYEGSPFTVLQTSTKVFPLDTFKHVAITFTYVGSPRAVVTVDGVVHLDKPIAAPAPTNTRTKLDLGIYNGSPCPQAVEVRFDNLLYFLKTR